MDYDIEKLHQHIMIDTALLKRIVDYANIKSDEIVLEIGAGPGNLTELLAEKAKEVFRALKHEHPEYSAGKKARIANAVAAGTVKH